MHERSSSVWRCHALIHAASAWLRAHPLETVIIAVALFLRTYRFVDIPHGWNQDELSGAYDAWSILQDGMDRHGMPFPAYFISWCSSSHVLSSYLSNPFMAIG